MVRAGQLLVLAAAFLVITARPADACTCAGRIAVCEAFWKTPVVFEGEVLSIVPVANSRGEEYPPERRVRFAIGKVHRGDIGDTAELMTGAGGGDCGYTFKQGGRYLVYANFYAGKLTAGICSRTRLLADAAEDLEYLKTAVAPSAGGRVFGRATYGRASFNDPEVPAVGYRILLKNEEEERITRTNAAGTFEFDNLAIGKYGIRIVVPDSERSYGGSPLTGSTVEIVDTRGCAAADFMIVPIGHITMRVVDAEQRPKSQLVLELQDANGKWARRIVGVSDENGDVTFSPVSPGRYIVGLNTAKVADQKQPYPTLYYPGVRDPSQAEVVEIQRGGRLQLGTFVLPPPLLARQLTGSVQWPDGRPAAGVHVYVVGVGTSWITGSGNTDENGRFSIPVYDGITYRVVASITSPAPERATSQATVEGLTVREGVPPVTLQLRHIR